MNNHKIQWGAMLLIVGTCIGAGMIALPVVSAPSGFFFSLLLLLVCWLVMYLSGLLLMEVTLSLPEGASFSSMAQQTLGTVGKQVAFVAYALLLYSLMAAYLSGGGDLFRQILRSFGGYQAPGWVGPWPWILTVGGLVYVGVDKVDYLNRVCMSGLFVTFFIILAYMFPSLYRHIGASTSSLTSVKPTPIELLDGTWVTVLSALPVVITAFGYHVVVPSVRNYVKSRVGDLRHAILWGSLIPLVIYLLWELEIFELIPLKGQHSLMSILKHGHVTTELSLELSRILHSTIFGACVAWFVFFALASSFLGISLSLFDLLTDNKRFSGTHSQRIGATLATMLPPFLYAVWYPKGFIWALSYAGIFVAILNIGLPAVMAWRTRAMTRARHTTQVYQAPGGMGVIWAMIGCACFVIAADLFIVL